MAQRPVRSQDSHTATVAGSSDTSAPDRPRLIAPDGRVREVAVLVGIALLAMLSGILAKEADESTLTWAANLGTYPAAWVLALALIGRLAPGLTQAAIRSSVFFVAMCLAYYAWARYVLNFPVDRDFYFWLLMAVTGVPVIAATVHWASIRNGALAGVILASVAALAVADRLAWQLWWAWVLDQAPDGFPLSPVQGLFSIVVAVIVAALLPRYSSTRLYGLAFLLPAAVVMDSFVDRVLGTVFGMF